MVCRRIKKIVLLKLVFNFPYLGTVTNLQVPQFSSHMCSQYINSFIRIPERRDHSSGLYVYPRKNIENINKQTIFRIFSDCVLLILS